MQQQFLNQIEKRFEQTSGSFQPGFDFNSHRVLESEVKKQLSWDLQTHFSNFLRITNGLYLNEVIIFASEKSNNADGIEIPGFVEENVKYRKEDKRFINYIVFAVSKKDRFLFVYNLFKKEHQIIDDEKHQVVERVKSFEVLINHALSRSLFAY